ncbi:MAG: L-rhamnose/proton symporter RhaT [Planctomycetes bacterium]|nr:L-rhamnose/proton symporter RhaT [Planctomycetota bacterium]
MTPQPFLGVALHGLGGLAAASFYLPFRRVRGWAWETYWLVGGFFSWIVAPWTIAWLVAPDLLGILLGASKSAVFWCYFYGVLWGIGGLAFGLSMRYLGMSLGYALSLGFCAAFGTILPPIYEGESAELLGTTSGLVTLLGVAVCLAGIALCGGAGLRKERELSDEQKKAVIREYSLFKGMAVAFFAGVMSACMAFGISAGESIAERAVEHGVPDLWKNTPIFVVILAGGFTTNFIWCVFLNLRSGTARDYLREGVPLLSNYAFSCLAGITWYLQFMFYGMGTTRMGKYDFSSWTIHMAFIIVFSNLWGLLFREWRGVSRSTRALVWAGIAVLILSTLVIARGNYLASAAE